MRQLGNAAHLLGVRPWEWDRLTVEEADRLLDWIDQYEADLKKAG